MSCRDGPISHRNGLNSRSALPTGAEKPAQAIREGTRRAGEGTGAESKQCSFSNNTDWTLRSVYEEDHALLEENFRAYT